MHTQLLTWALVTGCLGFAGPALGQAATAEKLLGGKLYYTGGDVQVKMVPASARFTSELGLYTAVDSARRKQLIASSREADKLVTIAAAQLASYGIAKGDELIFGILVKDTSHTYFLGDGTRNPDKIAHANVSVAEGKATLVGFEDAFGGGDRDYDDNVFHFTGAIKAVLPPSPAPSSSNKPPDCSNARPSVTELWPPNHKLVPVTVEGITDADPFKIQIVSIFQDEPVGEGNKSPDGEIVDGSSVRLRAERAGGGDSRVYNITFNAVDSKGAKCPDTTISVAVPHNRRAETPPKGPVTYDSTKASEKANVKTKTKK